MAIIKKEDFFNFLMEEQEILITKRKTISDFLEFLKTKINSDNEIVATLMSYTIDISINSTIFDSGLLRLEVYPNTESFKLFHSFGPDENSFEEKTNYLKTKIAQLVLDLIQYIRDWERLVIEEELGAETICSISLSLEEQPQLIESILNTQNLKSKNFNSITCEIKVFGERKTNNSNSDDLDFEWI